MEWFRWYHGACSDAKWPIIARKAKVSVGVVVSVWAALLEYASQDDERGSVAGFDGETYDALYGYEDGTCDAVLAAMIEKSLICDGCICAWSRRQAVREREDATNAERQRRYRERKKQENADENIENIADVTPRTVTRNAVTPRNASVTPPEQNREEQRREERNTPPTQEYFNTLNTRARVELSGKEGGGEAAEAGASAVPGEPGGAEELAGEGVPLSDLPGPSCQSRPGPARTDAPSKGTPEWTAFLSCWDVYPVRQGQEEAWREWMRLKRNGTLEAAWVIREAILTMCAEDSRWLRGKVPKFARWLNGKGWNDMPYVEPGEADAVRGGRYGPALPGGGRGKEPAAPTEYQRQRQSSRRMAAALLAGRQEGGVTETGTGTGTGGVYEATAFATAGGTLPAVRTGSLA